MHIKFTHDLFRSGCGAGDPERNGKWLLTTLAPLVRAAGCSTDRLTETDPAIAQTVAALVAGPDAHARWARLFSDETLLPGVTNACAPLGQCDLVIGYELTPNQMRCLSRTGQRFLDISIDPIRFAPDLFLRMRTNDQTIRHALEAHEVAESAMQQHAARLRAGIVGAAALPGFDGGALLFVGQTDIDASLIAHATLAGIDAYIPVIARLLQTEGGRLLIKPHPYGQRHQGIHTLRGRFPDALTVNDNIYALLHDPGIARMVTLSSGVAQEASLLGKAATTLLQPDNRRESLGAELVSRDFRIGVAALPGLLRMALDRRSGRAATLTPRPAGHLRRVIGQNWGYAGAPRLSKRCLAPGQTLSFAAHGRGVDLCTMGWSHAEATGLWSDGPFATMLVDTQGRDIDLTLACKAFVPVHGQPLAVHVHIEGADPSPRRLLFHTGRRARLTIALPARRGLTEIVFHLAGVTRPSERGGSADARRLGLYLMTGTVAAPGVRAGAEPVASVSPRRPASAMRAAAAVAALACGFSVGAASLQPPHGKLTVHTFVHHQG